MITVHDTITLLEGYFISTEHLKVIFERFNDEILQGSALADIQKTVHRDHPTPPFN